MEEKKSSISNLKIRFSAFMKYLSVFVLPRGMAGRLTDEDIQRMIHAVEEYDEFKQTHLR